MSREIKFRAWDGKRMRGISLTDWFNIRSDGVVPTESLDDSSISLMQFTGLLDMNEREIYEGDVIRMTIDPSEFNTRNHGIKNRQLETAVIKWSEDDLCFYPQFRPWLKWHPCFEHMRLADADAEVIGNIHENPELLQDATGKSNQEGNQQWTTSTKSSTPTPTADPTSRAS